jgi:hypothetical protein
MAGRNIIYYQIFRDEYSEALLSSPFTHIYLAALHINRLNDDLTLFLNNCTVEGTQYDSLWEQWIPEWKNQNKSVMLLLGGGGNGTWDKINADPDKAVGLLLGVFNNHQDIAGIDLDIEGYNGNLLELVAKIISRLKEDANRHITITMSPTPDQVDEVDKIQRATGGMLDWVNVQMYADLGVSPADLATTYKGFVANCTNLDPAHIVAAIDLDAGSCATREDMCTYVAQICDLAKQYPTFGGVAMWEYLYVFDKERQFLQQWLGCAFEALGGNLCQYCSGK